MFDEGYGGMRVSVLAAILILVPFVAFSGGAEEKDLECYGRGDELEKIDYQELASEVGSRLNLESEVLVCMSRLEEGDNVRTVAEVRLLPKGAGQQEPDEGTLSMGVIRLHQEIIGALGGERLSPYFPIQLLPLPTENYDFSQVETIATYVGLVIMDTSPEAMNYRIGSVRRQDDSNG